MTRIFISYRGEASRLVIKRIDDRLKDAFWRCLVGLVLVLLLIALIGFISLNPQLIGLGASPIKASAPLQVAQVATSTTSATPSLTLIPTVSPTPLSLEEALSLASTPVSHNADWTPIERDFNGVTMVLVPAGCFQMGNDPDAYYWNGSSYVTNVPDGGEQCFDAFWIDKYEVSQGQFSRLGGTKANDNGFTGANRPVEQITWQESRDFCVQKRGGQLPTEAEWEYAARGPLNWDYPWGNDWDESKAVWHRSSDDGTADVGSIPTGASWVGALDMSGNVWEWMHSVYADYPYVKGDGRENDRGNETSVLYALRGGSWDSDYAGYLRAASRLRFLSWDYSVGFRCVLSYE